MHSFITLLKKDFLEIKKNSKWLIYLFVFSLVSVLSVATAKILPELLNQLLKETGMEGFFYYQSGIADSYAQYVANMGEISFLLIIVMFATTLINEKNSGTYYLLKNNKVSETKIVMSHFISKLILITVSYFISIGIFIGLNLIVFKEYTGLRGVVSLSYVYLTLIFALALSLFISSIVKKKSSGYVIAIVVYFIMSLLSGIPYIDVYNPLYSLVLASNIITDVDYEIADFVLNLIILVTSIIALIGCSIYLFKNKIDNRK